MTSEHGDCALDKFNEAHSPMNIDVLIDDLSAVMCELIAFCGDTKIRNKIAKDTAKVILARVRHFRETGRYPGGWAHGTGAEH